MKKFITLTAVAIALLEMAGLRACDACWKIPAAQIAIVLLEMVGLKARQMAAQKHT